MAPGHFYFSILSLEVIREEDFRIITTFDDGAPSVELNRAKQFRLLGQFRAFYQGMKLQVERDRPVVLRIRETE